MKKKLVKVVVTRVITQTREYVIEGPADMTQVSAENTAEFLARKNNDWPEPSREDSRFTAKAERTAVFREMPTCPDCERALHTCHCEP